MEIGGLVSGPVTGYQSRALKREVSLSLKSRCGTSGEAVSGTQEGEGTSLANTVFQDHRTSIKSYIFHRNMQNTPERILQISTSCLSSPLCYKPHPASCCVTAVIQISDDPLLHHCIITQKLCH